MQVLVQNRGRGCRNKVSARALFLRVIFFPAYCELHSFIVHTGAGGNFTETMNYSYCKHSFFPSPHSVVISLFSVPLFFFSFFPDRVLIGAVPFFSIETTLPNFVRPFPLPPSPAISLGGKNNCSK